MKLIVGLGNPGKDYDNTRHNVGYSLVDLLVEKLGKPGNWSDKSKFKCLLIETEYNFEKIIILKPTTYMNLSGESVLAVKNFYKINLSDVWIVHDDLDLPLGILRIKFGGGSGGHHGLQSITSNLNSDQYLRLRIGIGKAGDKSVMDEVEGSNYVLGKFNQSEKKIIEAVGQNFLEAIDCCLNNKIEKCMSLYNKIPDNLPMENKVNFKEGKKS